MDITLQQAIHELEDKLSLYSNIVENNKCIIFISDSLGKIEYVNSAIGEVTGYLKEEVIGKDISSHISCDLRNGYYEKIQETLRKNEVWNGELRGIKKSGEIYWSDCKIYPVLNRQDQIAHLIIVQEYITEKKLLEGKVNYLVSLESIDSMTGLLTRTKFIELLNDLVSSAKVKGFNGVLLVMNIDNFRLINDAFGTNAGDAVLRQYSLFLNNIINQSDTEYFILDANEHEIMESLIGYMGGDEFAVFLHS